MKSLYLLKTQSRSGRAKYAKSFNRWNGGMGSRSGKNGRVHAESGAVICWIYSVSGLNKYKRSRRDEN